MKLALACVAFAGLPRSSAAQQPASYLPFESLGQILLKEAGSVSEGDVSKRIAALHERIELGGVELWIPRRVLDEEGEFGGGPKPAAVKLSVEALLALETIWIPRLEADVAALDRARADIEVLRAWWKGVKRFPLEPQPAQVEAARRRLARVVLGGPPSPTRRPLVLVVAPTRAQYVGVIGAAGVVSEPARARLWQDGERNVVSESLDEVASVVAWSAGSAHGDGPALRGTPFDEDEATQWVVHSVSHQLAIRRTPMASTWFAESLAIVDTIGIAGADDTLCTGFSEKVAIPTQGRTPSTRILTWVTRDRSPFRDEASATWFRGPLRKAATKGGFEVLDLSNGKAALRLEGPFLGEDFQLPASVAGASEGTKRGFAELFRAYGAAFVHWLDGRESGDATCLDAICRELARRPFDPLAPRMPLYAIAQALTARTLGVSMDATGDLEGEFAATLRRP